MTTHIFSGFRRIPDTPDWEPSPLNDAITQRYQRCLAAGTHRGGHRDTPARWYYGESVRMVICDTCEVPVLPWKQAMAQQVVSEEAA